MKKYIVLVIGSLLISNLFLFLTNSYEPIASKYRYATLKLGQQLNENFGEITSPLEINQSIVAERDNLSGLNLFFSTFNRLNTGETIIKILDNDRNEVLRTVILKNEEIEDNKYRKITFPPIKGVKNETLFINISSTAQKNNGITLWKDSKTAINTKLFIDNNPVEGTLVFDIIYENILNYPTVVIINLVVLFLNFLVYLLFRFLRR